jgi:hypothetical protein
VVDGEDAFPIFLSGRYRFYDNKVQSDKRRPFGEANPVLDMDWQSLKHVFLSSVILSLQEGWPMQETQEIVDAPKTHYHRHDTPLAAVY